MGSLIINFGLGLTDLYLAYWIGRVVYSAIHPKPNSFFPLNSPLLPLDTPVVHTNPKDPCPDPCPDIVVPANIVHLANGAAISGLSYTQSGWVFKPQYLAESHAGISLWELTSWSVTPPPEAHCYNINYPDSVGMLSKVALDPLTGKAHVSFSDTKARNGRT